MSIFTAISGAESSNRNVAGPWTSSGQAQGYYQITTGTWGDFAPKAGVNLSQYPTPLSAPLDVQTSVASQIPLNRWTAGKTAALQQYHGLDPSQTVGTLAQKTGDTSTTVANQPAHSFDPATGETQATPGIDPGIGAIAGGSGAAAGEPGFLPPAATGGPFALGITTGLASYITTTVSQVETAVGNSFKGIVSTAENWVGRGFLIVVGLVLVFVALWRLLAPDVSAADVARAVAA